MSPGGVSARLQEPRRWQRWTAVSGITTRAEIVIVQVLTLFKLDARVVASSNAVPGVPWDAREDLMARRKHRCVHFWALLAYPEGHAGSSYIARTEADICV